MQEGTQERKYLSKALQMLIQDLAELIIENESESPRNITKLNDGKCRRISKKIHAVTSVPLGSRTIRDFKSLKTIGSTLSRDVLAALWFFETRRVERNEIDLKQGGEINGYWDRYMALFRGKKAELTTFLGLAETVTHEFKEEFIPAEEIATNICAFANKDGGYIIFGVGRDNTSLVGIDNNSALIKTTRAALRSFGTTRPKVDFGWGWHDGKQKPFFLIRVFKSPSGTTYRADGIEHIRDGATIITVGKNDPQNETFQVEPATDSRRPLIENMRRMKSIIDDHMKFWKEYKKPSTSEEEKQIFYLISLKFIRDTFITYLSEIWKEVSRRKALGNEYSLSIIEREINQSIKELRKGRAAEFLDKVKNIPEIHKTVATPIEALNALVLNPPNDITSTKLFEVLAEISSLAKQIDRDTNRQFHLTRTRVRI
jgi:Putative DNA-binding domain